MSLAQSMLALKRSTILRSSDRLDQQLRRDERVDPETLARLQGERAIAHARFAMQHTAFYRNLYRDAGFKLKDLDDPAAFASLPIVEKADVRAHTAAFRSDEATDRNSVVSTTGGSTGEPLRLLRDKRFQARALEWRLFRWWGVEPSDNVAIVSRHVRSKRDVIIHDLQWWPSKRLQLDAYRMDAVQMDGFIGEWQSAKPAIIIGYVGGMTELARFLETNGVAIHRPRAVAVTAAPLTPAGRAAIEAAFGAPVYDHYRSAEIPWMGGECREQNGLHIFQDVRKLEVLDDAGAQVAPGEVGQVVVSDLTNRVFPLIRYRLGDRTSPIDGECACGVTLPRITQVAGRVSEALRMPDGQVIAGEGLTQLFAMASSAVRQFQIHQQADRSITVRVVTQNTPEAPAAIERAVGRLGEITGGKVAIRTEIVDSIPHDGGKVRYIRSDVPA